MPTLQLSSAQSSLESLDVDAVVVGITGSDKTIELGPGAAAIDTALAGRLADTLRQLGATGATGQVTKLATLGATTAPVVVAVGLGERNEDGPGHGTVRSATGAAIRALTGTHRVAVALAADDAALLRPTVEGAGDGTVGLQPTISPSSVVNKKAALPFAVPSDTKKSSVGLKIWPVGAPPGKSTISELISRGSPLKSPS